MISCETFSLRKSNQHHTKRASLSPRIERPGRSIFTLNNITMADNEDDQDLVDYDEEEEEQNVAAEESADAEGKETKK